MNGLQRSNAFGTLGAWLSRDLPRDQLLPLAASLEDLGYGTIWISGGGEPGVFDVVADVLAETSRVKVATGVVNIWAETPVTVTSAWHRLEDAHPGRLYVGLGISHATMIEGTLAPVYDRPVDRTREFLDELDGFSDPLPSGRRLLAALGPRMLALAAERTLGTHPYLATTENVAAARAVVGDAIVAPELGIVLDDELTRARAAGRLKLARYFTFPNYTNNWRRAGYGDGDLADGGSDRLVDALLAIGDANAIRQRIAAYVESGADHVALQPLGEGVDRGRVLAEFANFRT